MTRGPEKQFDPEVALQKAMELFWANGYAATGVAELMEHMGIGKRSLYDTFGNKRQLYVKALEHYSNTVLRDLVGTLNGAGSPLNNVRRLMRRLLNVNAKPCSVGCLLGVSLAQFRTDDAEMAAALRRYLQAVEDAFYQAFKRAQSKGELGPERNIRELARLFLGVTQAVSMTGRVMDGPATLRGMVNGALSALEAA